MRFLLSTALLGVLLLLTFGCQDKVTMPTRTYEPPTMADTATSGGAADEPAK